MKIISLITITFALVYFPQLLFSQAILRPSYIINNQRDTVWGRGHMEFFQTYFLFQQFNMSIPLRFSPDEIICIRFDDGKNYVSREIINKKRKFSLYAEDTIISKCEKYFLEYLLDGEVDIFVLQDLGEKRFFIEKAGMPLSELKISEVTKEVNGKQYSYINPILKGILKLYMFDSPLVYEQIENLNTLNQKSLIDLSTEYHYSVCHDQECVNYTKKIFRERFKKKNR